MTNEERLSAYLEMIEDGLSYYLPHVPIAQATLFDAVHYSLMDAGKRIRPVILLEFVRMCGGQPEKGLPFACAIEMIHTYSLIHDDLPCMDDSDMRRGKPSNHVVFGEPTAVLAGDALLTYAFECMLDEDNVGDTEPARVMKAAHNIAWNAGIYGMVGGQFLDMNHDEMEETVEAVRKLHGLKTGAIIRSAAETGCIIGGGNEDEMSAATAYANALGLAFQIKDDILNIEGDAAVLGKDIATDMIDDKLTFVRVLGIEKCRDLLKELTEEAKKAVSGFKNNEFLLWLADLLLNRDH